MPEVALRLAMVDSLDQYCDLLVDLGDLAETGGVCGRGEEGGHFGADGVVDGDGDVVDGGREVGWNVGADGVGKGYGLEGEDVRESEFGDLGEVETVALEYLGDVRPKP